MQLNKFNQNIQIINSYNWNTSFNKLMKFKVCCKNIFQACDLFSASQFLRYKNEENYSTVSGGIVSLMVISVFLALFFNTAIQTINKSIISFTSTVQYQSNPTSTNITLSNTGFMFAVGLLGLNLNDPSFQYFDITLKEKYSGMVGAPISQRSIALQACTQQHFSISSQLIKNFHEMPANTWLCPQINQTFELFGKFTSPFMKNLEVSISPCTGADRSRPCISEDQIDNIISNYGPIAATYFYVNPRINPGDANYLDYYFQTQNFLTFTKSLGAYSIGFVQDFQIDTDESLLPFTDYKIDTGTVIPNLFQTVPYQYISGSYVSFMIMKSSQSKTHVRSFNKFDQFFSYVGGLVGTILGFMLFMSNFTSMAFTLDLSQSLFTYNDKDKTDFKKFSLLTYIKYLFYKLGVFFKKFKDWEQMKKRHKCFSQTTKQLDVTLFLKRMQFLQKSVESLLGKQEYYQKHLEQKQILATIKARRKLHSIKVQKKLNKEAIFDNQSSQQSQSEQKSQNEKKIDLKENNTFEMINECNQIKVDPFQQPQTVIYHQNFVSQQIQSIKRFRKTGKLRQHLEIKKIDQSSPSSNMLFYFTQNENSKNENVVSNLQQMKDSKLSASKLAVKSQSKDKITKSKQIFPQRQK